MEKTQYQFYPKKETLLEIRVSTTKLKLLQEVSVDEVLMAPT